MGEGMKLKVWEALAATGATPQRCILLMESQRITVTIAEAEEQLAAARSRNTLRLVKAGELKARRDPVARVLRSHWHLTERAAYRGFRDRPPRFE